MSTRSHSRSAPPGAHQDRRVEQREQRASNLSSSESSRESGQSGDSGGYSTAPEAHNAPGVRHGPPTSVVVLVVNLLVQNPDILVLGAKPVGNNNEPSSLFFPEGQVRLGELPHQAAARVLHHS